MIALKSPKAGTNPGKPPKNAVDVVFSSPIPGPLYPHFPLKVEKIAGLIVNPYEPQSRLSLP
jgi:hypothetical protein